ncbi:MAG: TetR/AcrR family transcriptional regulator [Proteobacteria bacterium]|nr:TetR/AcrR family transcriptional regulator [Pseudomonadota bacterium]
MPEGKYDQQVLKAAREHFSDFGFFGARIDTIASSARVNKRMVYEFCHTKDGLYMIALSDVSREAMERFQQCLPSLQNARDIRGVYEIVLNLFDTLINFVRLLAWERMYMTIHGPRILETANDIFERIRRIIEVKFPECNISPSTFDAIEALCHSYLLAVAMYSRKDDAEEGEDNLIENSKSVEESVVSAYTKDIVLDCITKLLCQKSS